MDELNAYTREELEEAKKEEMRDLLIDAFQGKSVLYEIYQRRNWLDRLFTEKIISMDKDTLYTSKQVADICETKDYVIKNKRRELLEYINPVVMGDDTTKIYKHNYISVFKLKMIDGLTGEGSEYTLPQIKELIYGTINKQLSEKKPEATQNDIIFQIMKKIDQHEQVMKNLQEIVASSQLLLESNSEETKYEVIELYEKIVSADTAISEKEQLVEQLIKMEFDHPGEAFTIRMYRNLAEERVSRYKQDEKEAKIRKLKEKVTELMNKYESSSEDKERVTIREKINTLAMGNSDLHFEIRMWLSSVSKEKKRGFWGKFFS